MKYKDRITQWLHFYVRPTVKQRTFEHYEGVARRQLIPCLGGYELDALRPAVLQAFTGLDDEKKKFVANQVYYLAMLSYKKLSPEEMKAFTANSVSMLEGYIR